LSDHPITRWILSQPPAVLEDVLAGLQAQLDPDDYERFRIAALALTRELIATYEGRREELVAQLGLAGRPSEGRS